MERAVRPRDHVRGSLWCVAGEKQIVTHYITYVVRGRRATDDATPSAPPPRTAPAPATLVEEAEGRYKDILDYRDYEYVDDRWNNDWDDDAPSDDAVATH